MSEQIGFREGDIFRWRYNGLREIQLRKCSHDPYWAKSCIGVVKDGLLWDTFWSSFDSNTVRWSEAEAQHELQLTYVGNFADLVKTPEHKAVYYADADCVNLNHSNSGRDNFYIRKGAQRNREKMLAVVSSQLETAENQLRSAQRQIDRLKELGSKLMDESTDIGEVYL